MIQPALAGAAMVPVAAVRTAGAVRDLSDSSLILRLTRGRGWIGVLGTLLFGIVALNVISLSLNAGSGRIGQQVAELERENSALRAQVAEGLSASQVEGEAERLGLAVPDPEDVGYLTVHDGDAERLAELLEKDTFLSSPPSSFESATTSPSSAAPEISAPDPAPAAAAEAVAPAPPSGGESSGGGSTGGGSTPSGGGGVGL
jgi:hypothetical protein